LDQTNIFLTDTGLCNCFNIVCPGLLFLWHSVLTATCPTRSKFLNLKQIIFVNMFVIILHNCKLIVTLLQHLISLLILLPITVNPLTVYFLHQTL